MRKDIGILCEAVTVHVDRDGRNLVTLHADHGGLLTMEFPFYLMPWVNALRNIIARMERKLK